MSCGGTDWATADPAIKKNEERDETLMKIPPKFVQVTVPRWVASLPEIAQVLVGHQGIGSANSQKPVLLGSRKTRN